MLNTLLFRVDANATMGMGHLLRCLALAQALVKKSEQEQTSLKIVFVVKADTVSLCKQRQDWCGELLVLPEHLPQADEPAYLAAYCKRQQVAALVLDGYQFATQYRQSLSEIAVKHIIFDDNNDSGPLFADLVINGASNAEQLAYAVSAPQAVLCVGSAYRLLRQEFNHPDYKLEWYLRSKLTLVMGGSDPRNFSIKILRQLEQQGFRAKITLATGGAYAHVDELKQFLSQSALHVEHLQNCQTMAELFGQSLLVVSAAGGSQFELQAMYSPALLLVIADNQRNATLQAAKQAWCEAINCITEDNIELICERLTDLWSKHQQLELMHDNCKSLPQHDGASKVADCILQLISQRSK